MVLKYVLHTSGQEKAMLDNHMSCMQKIGSKIQTLLQTHSFLLEFISIYFLLFVSFTRISSLLQRCLMLACIFLMFMKQLFISFCLKYDILSSLFVICNVTQCTPIYVTGLFAPVSSTDQCLFNALSKVCTRGTSSGQEISFDQALDLTLTECILN